MPSTTSGQETKQHAYSHRKDKGEALEKERKLQDAKGSK